MPKSTLFRRYLGRGEVELAEGRAEARRDFDVYFENGGFPETFSVLDRKTYFKLLYDSILFRDILRRHKVRNPALLMNVSYVMMSNFACEVSALKLARQLGVKGVHTVQNYIHYLEEGYMIETLPLYGRKAWERTRMGKSYAIDVGFANYFTGLLAGDERMGRCLENIVFLQLRNRRSDLDFDIFFWKDANGEIDFLCERRGRVMKLIQVAYDISAEKTRKRELSTLFAAGKKFKCDDLVLVTDRVNEVVKEGRQMVRIVDVVTWLFETDREQIRDDLFARAKGSAVEVKRMRNQNREQGTGNREQGTGNREQGIGNRELRDEKDGIREDCRGAPAGDGGRTLPRERDASARGGAVQTLQCRRVFRPPRPAPAARGGARLHHETSGNRGHPQGSRHLEGTGAFRSHLNLRRLLRAAAGSEAGQAFRGFRLASAPRLPRRQP